MKEKMRLSLTVPSLGNEVFAGEIRLVGRSFNMDNKTVRVHGHIEGKHPAFIRGLYVEAKIWNDDETVPALPDERAIVTSQAYFLAAQVVRGELANEH